MAGTTPVPVVPPTPLEGVTGEVILTRQRDLLDRGLVNVLTHNRSGTSILLSDIQLVADFFEMPPAAPRTVSVRSGRRVAVQVPYGVVVDCDAEGPVGAELPFTYTTDRNHEPSTARIDLAGTEILDTIRARPCTTRRFDDTTQTRFEDTKIVDGTVVTRLVIEPTEMTADLAVMGGSGTVLVGVRQGAGAWAATTHLRGDAVTLPLTFVVNRCDPHALAEVTKRYGLALAVSVDGTEPVDVAIDISELVADLETAVEQCTAAAAE